MTSPKEILDKLEAGDFTAPIGLMESDWLDAKESPHVLDKQKQKLELAKNVTAMANASGGIIVIGFDCENLPTTAGEQIREVKGVFERRWDDSQQAKLERKIGQHAGDRFFEKLLATHRGTADVAGIDWN